MCFHICAVFYNVTSRFPLPQYFYLLCPLSGAWTQTWTWVQSAFLKHLVGVTICQIAPRVTCIPHHVCHHSLPVSVRVFLSVHHLDTFLISWHGETKMPPHVRSKSGASAVSQTLSLGSLAPFAASTTFAVLSDLYKWTKSCCSSHFALLCFTVAENSTLFAQKTYHLTLSYVHADITAMPQELTITSQCKAVFVLNYCSWLMQCLALYNLSR